MIFLFFGSYLAHLEPELELFEVDDIGDDGDDDLSYHYLLNQKAIAVLKSSLLLFEDSQLKTFDFEIYKHIWSYVEHLYDCKTKVSADPTANMLQKPGADR